VELRCSPNFRELREGEVRRIHVLGTMGMALLETARSRVGPETFAPAKVTKTEPVHERYARRCVKTHRWGPVFGTFVFGRAFEKHSSATLSVVVHRVGKCSEKRTFSIQHLILQRHFALPGSAASVLGTLQRSLIIFATH
jgi:hypothetical protein